MEEATAREELAAIRTLMADSQSFLRGTWPHQMVWGCVGTVGLLATWALGQSGRYGLVPWVWVAAVSVGWTYSLFLARDHSRAPVRNVAGRAFGGIWMALGVTLTLLGTVTVFVGAVDPRGLPGVIAVVFGAGYFASGFLAEMRWLAGVGVAWWAAGVVLLLWQSEAAILALAALTLLLEVGPALVLRSMERSAHR